MLSSAGHIAGIVNPPSKSAVHWTNERIGNDPDLWLAGATKKQETWWEDWARWLEAHGGERAAPPKMGSEAHPPLVDAPGTYVLAK